MDGSIRTSASGHPKKCTTCGLFECEESVKVVSHLNIGVTRDQLLDAVGAVLAVS